MAYSAQFHRLVMIGTLYDDIFNTTLSIIPGLSGSMPAVTDTLVDDVATAVANWWPLQAGSSPTGFGINANAKLTSVKLNRINTSGHYADPDTKEHLFGTPIAGGYTAKGQPPQLSVAVTLRGQDPRARAGKGRMFFPVCQYATEGLDASGRLSDASALIVANGAGNLLGAINDVYLSASINAVAGIASAAGTGAFQAVDTITVGRVVDTIRSRRNKLDEDPVVATSF